VLFPVILRQEKIKLDFFGFLPLIFGPKLALYWVCFFVESSFFVEKYGKIGFVFYNRVYPNNPFYYGWLQSPIPALSAKNVLNVAIATPPILFDLPPWPRTFRSAS